MTHQPSATARRTGFDGWHRATGRVEHITIESAPEVAELPASQQQRATLRRCTLSSRLKGCATALSILEGHYLAVRCTRPDGQALEYQFDLRFARPAPVRVHHVPWAWVVTALAVAMLGGVGLAWAWSSGVPVREPFVLGGLFSGVIGIFGLVASARRARTALQIRSVHGDVPLVSVTDRLGSFREGNEFFVEVGSCAEAARRTRPQAKQAYLCDQMREHHRLHQLGVLTDREYESGKARILAAH